MKVTITRFATGKFDPNQGTPGVLTIEGSSFTCSTLELPWRDNAADVSRIPIGTYRAKVVSTNNPELLPEVYELDGVPDREFCMIHNGNYAGDKKMGFRSDVEGCTLLGAKLGLLDPGVGFNGPQLAVLNSRATVDAFMAATYGAPISVTYQDAA